MKERHPDWRVNYIRDTVTIASHVCCFIAGAGVVLIGYSLYSWCSR